MKKISYTSIVIALCIILSVFSVMGQTEEVFSLIELQDQISKRVDLDTFIIKTGVYKDVTVDILNASRKDKLYILPETPGQVVVTGKSSIRITNSKNIELSGFLFSETKLTRTLVIDNCKNISVTDNYFYKCGGGRFAFILAIVNGSRRNEIYSNTFDSNTALSVVVVTDGSNHLNRRNKRNKIFQNIFKNTPDVKTLFPSSNGNGMEAIQIGQGNNGSFKWRLYTEIYGNHFENIIGDRAEIISVKSSNNSIYNNTFVNNVGGISLRLGNNVKVYNNILYNTAGGIRLYGKGHKITGNFIYGGYYGLQMPAANFPHARNNREPLYYQARNIEVFSNFFANQSRANIIIGSGYVAERSYNPVKVRLVDNLLVVDSTLQFILFDNNSINNSNLRLSENKRSNGIDEQFQSHAEKHFFQILPAASSSSSLLHQLENEIQERKRMVGASWGIKYETVNKED